jgi:hypothetical protein
MKSAVSTGLISMMPLTTALLWQTDIQEVNHS